MRLAWMSHRDRIFIALGVLLPLGLAAALIPYRASFPNSVGALALVAAVVFVAANGHRVAGFVAAASAAVWFDFFLTTPYEHFTITHRGDIETTVLLMAVGVAVTELAIRGRRARNLAQHDELYLGAIASTIDMLAESGPSNSATDHLCALITQI